MTAAEDLDGATTAPPESMRIADAGEFAAVWNEATPEQREEWFARWADTADRATRCVMQDHDGLKRQLDLAWSRFFVLAGLLDSGVHGRELRRKARRVLFGEVR